jgi:hypothetical protein
LRALELAGVAEGYLILPAYRDLRGGVTQQVVRSFRAQVERRTALRCVDTSQHQLWDAADLLMHRDTRSVCADLIARERIGPGSGTVPCPLLAYSPPHPPDSQQSRHRHGHDQ